MTLMHTKKILINQIMAIILNRLTKMTSQLQKNLSEKKTDLSRLKDLLKLLKVEEYHQL